MEKITCTLKRSSEAKIFLSVMAIVLYSVFSACFYGFLIGGSQFKVSYITYVIFSSFIVSVLLCFFMFGKTFFQRVFGKAYRDGQVCIFIAFLLIICNCFLYSPFNKLSASDSTVIEYETEIIWVESKNRFITEKIYFKDINDKEVFMICYAPPIQEEPFAQDGGRMIVRENIGGFGVKYYELKVITYQPEVIK